MKFEVDKQTLKDLEIVSSSSKSRSVLDYLDFTHCLGSKQILKSMLTNPLTDASAINDRLELISFFKTHNFRTKLEIDKNDLDFIEHYLSYSDRPTKKPSNFSVLEKAVIQKLTSQSNEQYIIERGIDYTIQIFNNLHCFLQSLETTKCPKILEQMKMAILNLYKKKEFQKIASIKQMRKLKALEIAELDYMLRQTHSTHTRYVIDMTYELDVFISLAEATEKLRLTLPKVEEREQTLDITELRHFCMLKAVKNDISFDNIHNTSFISGPNMAGKSTFLKALGIAVYLAHCGLPVSAKRMTFSPLMGLYSTINLPDSLNNGESHFYTEVQRIKQVAQSLKEKKNMFVIFDELFRGTNVKDAYDGSLAVIKAFAKISSSYFAVSTHIVEVTEKLKDIESIQFKYMEVTSMGDNYNYSYKLKDGISEDRLGMYIIEKEKLIELIESCSETYK